MRSAEENERKMSKNLEKGGLTWYREKISEMVEHIEDMWILETVHKFIIGMTKEGD